MAKKYQSSLSEQKVFQHSTFVQHEEIKKQITIIPALEALIPPLNTEENTQLEANIIKDGCREALLVWPTTENIIDPINKPDSLTQVYILVDGHNRYRICSKNAIDFSIHLINYKTLDDVRGFMIDNQLGRRNLSIEQMSYLRGMKYIHLRQEKGKYNREDHKAHNEPYDNEIVVENHKAHNEPYDKDDKKVTTAQQLATEFNVAQATIKRDAVFAAGLEKLSPAFKSEVLSGKSKINKKIIQQLAKIDVPEQKINSVDELERYLEVETQREQTAKTPTILKPEETIIEQIDSLVKKLSASTNRKEICEEIIRLVNKLH
jgi:hypothetical protein